ncbi:MAG: hypothetical protein JOY86_07830 [Candidatus Eremiobacteraeota bacterium]|nr:hypothetical protein [Candidatus Eremiobacteraeota bacterium]
MVAVGLVKRSLVAEVLKGLGKAIILFVPVMPFFGAVVWFNYSGLAIVMIVAFCVYLSAAGGWVLFPRHFPELLKLYCALFLIATLWFWFFVIFVVHVSWIW